MEPVTIYWDFDGENDIPVSGVAEFQGKAHYFVLRGYEFDHPRTADFDLAPVSELVLPRILELAAIWRRWELAYHGGEVALDTWPALPIEVFQIHDITRA